MLERVQHAVTLIYSSYRLDKSASRYTIVCINLKRMDTDMENAGKPLKFGGEWTAEKLELVRKYLCAYTTALKNQPFKLVYIDAFAGTGYCGKGEGEVPETQIIPELAESEAQAFLKGSARTALEVEPQFHNFIFIDHDISNCAELSNLGDEYPDLKNRITVINADANTYLQELAKRNWLRQGERAVLFLDPYAMQVEWSTIQAVAQTQAIDMWYLFPLAAVNRLLRRDAEIDDAWRQRLDRIFGTNDWETAFYQRRATQTLFGEEESIEKVATFDGIKNFLLDRLKGEFADVVPNPVILENSRCSPLFLLCFAAGNPKGAPIAVKIARGILRR